MAQKRRRGPRCRGPLRSSNSRPKMKDDILPEVFPSRAISGARLRTAVASGPNASHGVTLRFAVFAPRGYRLIGSTIPLRPSVGPAVFPPSALPLRVLFLDAAPALRLRSPSEFDRARPPPNASAATLLGSGPLQRLQLEKPGCLGFASPDTFRLQGFAPSCRLASSRTFRPCFMPVTLLGFSLQGLSPSQSLRSLSGSGAFVVLAAVRMEPRLPGNPPDRPRHLQGFALCEDPSPPRRCEPPRKPLPSWFFWPLGISPPNRPVACAADPLASLAHALETGAFAPSP
jgi:hypothetical protein